MFRILFFISLLWVFNIVEANEKIQILPGITGTVEKIFPKDLEGHEEVEDRYFLKVKLGKLNQEKFNNLKNMFNNSSNVKYDSLEEFFLIDFLPPVAQALNAKALVSKLYEIKGLSYDPGKHGSLFPIFKNGIDVTSNCWNTSLEFLMSMHHQYDYVSFYIQDPYDFYSYTKSSSIETIKENLQPGDMFTVNQIDSFLFQHTAIIIGGGLIFERTSPNGKAPYRISYLSDAIKKFERLGKST